MFVAVKKQTNPTDSGAFYLDFTYKHAHPNGFKTHAELSNNFRTERFLSKKQARSNRFPLAQPSSLAKNRAYHV